ncbi:MAG: hypothetical protein ABSC21_15805 [Terriglobia bacterium]
MNDRRVAANLHLGGLAAHGMDAPGPAMNGTRLVCNPARAATCKQA